MMGGMTTTKYQKRCARLVQEALGVPYTRARRLVLEDQQARPERRTVEARALEIVEREDGMGKNG
jgi:hypothetical protein